MRRRLLLLCSIAVVVTGVLLGLNLSSGADTTKSSKNVVLPTARSAIQLAEREYSPGSIRRASAKLMTVRDLEAAFPDVTVPSLMLISRDDVWVVAVSGTPLDTTNVLPEHFRWGVDAINRRNGEAIAMFAGSKGRWPPYFSELPSMPVSA